MLKKGFLICPLKACPRAKEDDCTGPKTAQKFSSAEKGKSIACSMPHPIGTASSNPIRENPFSGLDPDRKSVV